MRCPKCNAEIPDRAKFCPKCGVTITSTATTSEAAAGSSGGPAMPKTELGKTKLGKQRLLIGTVIVVVSVVAIALAILTLHSETRKDAKDSDARMSKTGNSVEVSPHTDAHIEISTEINKEQGSISSGSCGNNVTYTLFESGTLLIAGTGTMDNYVPRTLPWSFDRDDVVAIEIENGVSSIGGNAFLNFHSLSTVSISDTVTSIGENAFCNCENLKSVNIPDSVTLIDACAFSYCVSLTDVVIPGSVQKIGFQAFSNCESMTDISILDGAQIGSTEVFKSCSRLESVSLPASIPFIDAFEFQNCTKLSSIFINGNISSVGQGAFDGCSNLTDVYFSGSEDTWGGVKIESGNNELLNAVIHYGRTLADDIRDESKEATFEPSNDVQLDGIAAKDRSASGSNTIDRFVWNGKKEVWAILPTTDSAGIVMVSDGMGTLMEKEGFTYIKKNADFESANQVAFVEEAIADGNVGCLMIAAMSPEELEPAVLQAINYGIAVVYFGVEPGDYTIGGYLIPTETVRSIERNGETVYAPTLTGEKLAEMLLGICKIDGYEWEYGTRCDF